MTTEDSARLAWFKSSHSGNEGGECLELAATPDTVHVRDSKEREQPSRTRLAFSHESWTAFVHTF